jgi:hypothetical protein
MTRRSTPQHIVDDRAFPIRIKIMTPWNGHGQRLDYYQAWLNHHGPDECAWHSGKVYFRKLEIASQFLANFPEIVLADSAQTRNRPGRSSAHGLNIAGSLP